MQIKPNVKKNRFHGILVYDNEVNLTLKHKLFGAICVQVPDNPLTSRTAHTHTHTSIFAFHLAVMLLQNKYDSRIIRKCRMAVHFFVLLPCIILLFQKEKKQPDVVIGCDPKTLIEPLHNREFTCEPDFGLACKYNRPPATNANTTEACEWFFFRIHFSCENEFDIGVTL